MRRIERFWPESKEQPWGQEVLVASTAHYTGKVLFYKAGEAGGLQYHMLKYESFYLFSGRAIVRYDNGNGGLVESTMEPGQTFQIPPGAPHQFEAITNCIVFEASTPGVNDRVNVGERYGRPPEPGTLPTTWSEEEIKAFEQA